MFVLVLVYEWPTFIHDGVHNFELSWFGAFWDLWSSSSFLRSVMKHESTPFLLNDHHVWVSTDKMHDSNSGALAPAIRILVCRFYLANAAGLNEPSRSPSLNWSFPKGSNPICVCFNVNLNHNQLTIGFIDTKNYIPPPSHLSSTNQYGGFGRGNKHNWLH